jgi:hypothetical protein
MELCSEKFFEVLNMNKTGKLFKSKEKKRS